MLDQEFPARLLEIEDVPPILYVKGNSQILNSKCAALVGTRKSSTAGEEMCGIAASVLVEEGFAVVSGLALGIDSAAHVRTLGEKGNTVAVLAHGLDRVTPSQNEVLAEKILQSGGALVSEHPPGVPPMKAEYVRRNRIQSGMSLCSIIAESGEAGGSIHQATFTVRQGRKLFVIFPPRPPEGFNTSGALHLIHSLNATPVSSREELRKFLRELNQLGPPVLEKPRGNIFVEASLFELSETGAKTTYRGLIPTEGVRLHLGDYELVTPLPPKYDCFATLELTRKSTSFRSHARWQWQQWIQKQEFSDRNLGYSVEMSDAGRHFISSPGESPLISDKLPPAGKELDALIVAEVFDGNPPVALFSPSINADHAALLIPELEANGFSVSTKGLVVGGKIASEDQAMFHFRVEKSGDFMAMQSHRSKAEWCRIVCETSIRAMRLSRKH